MQHLEGLGLARSELRHELADRCRFLEELAQAGVKRLADVRAALASYGAGVAVNYGGGYETS